MLITTLKRQVRADYLRRVENAARTTEDFRDLSVMYDKLDANRERRERYYEIGSVERLYELDYFDDGAVIPPPLCHPYWRELMSGEFISYIFDNPDEIWQIVSDGQISRPLRYDLTAKQREALFLRAIRLATTEQIACYTDKSDRGVRKLIAAALENVRKPLAKDIRWRLKKNLPVTNEKRRFIEWYDRKGGGESENT